MRRGSVSPACATHSSPAAVSALADESRCCREGRLFRVERRSEATCTWAMEAEATGRMSKASKTSSRGSPPSSSDSTTARTCSSDEQAQLSCSWLSAAAQVPETASPLPPRYCANLMKMERSCPSSATTTGATAESTASYTDSRRDSGTRHTARTVCTEP